MAQYASCETNGSPSEALRRFLADLLENHVVDALLAPARQSHGRAVMQTLIASSRHIAQVDVLAPVVWTNAGTLLSSLTFKPSGTPIAAVLRSCEVRAFVERVKLNQGSRDNLLLIGVDCFGRFENRDYLSLVSKNDSVADCFLRHATHGGEDTFEGVCIANACRACEYPVAPNVDIRVGLIGCDPDVELWLQATSEAGQVALAAVGLAPSQTCPAREQAVAALEQRRVEVRDQMFADYEAKTGDVDGLLEATAGCINCYNCRVACPVCYCRECVFNTDLFRHDAAKHVMWARKMGMLKMPTDTTFYHLTRMVHMSTLCVGCGQCSSACPNDIDVMELFRTTARKTQARFNYIPGRDIEEKQPMATFHEDELGGVGLGE